MTDNDTLIRDQVAYYRARAGEYDEWFFRTGRYDRGPEQRDRWESEVRLVEAELRQQLPAEHVLELACGTGLWTRHLAPNAVRLVAVDASPEVIAVNRDRTSAGHIEYLVADLFSWQPPARSFDMVFFGFWLSHVPPERFEEFWAMVRRALKPAGRVFWVDSLLDQSSTAKNHGALDTSGVTRRRLNDGREYRVVKVFYEPQDLERKLEQLGFRGFARSSGSYFHYGCVTDAG